MVKLLFVRSLCAQDYVLLPEITIILFRFIKCQLNRLLSSSNVYISLFNAVAMALRKDAFIHCTVVYMALCIVKTACYVLATRPEDGET